jgi:type II secretory pathway pseudopilin PulG
MKYRNFLSLAVICLYSLNNLSAQSDAAIRLENNKFYISYIQDYIEAMKMNTDSAHILQLLDQMDALARQVSEELDKIVIEDDMLPDTAEQNDNYSSEQENNQGYKWPDYDGKNGGYDNGGNDNGFNVPGLDIFNKRINTSLLFQFGLNGLQNNSQMRSNIPMPELNTGRSWFWEIGLMRKIRLGKEKSSTQFVYGLSYQSNRFRLQNDLRLTESGNNPLFVRENGLRNDPTLVLGYITLPVGFRFNFSEKFRLEAGAYAGYRVRSVQHLSRKTGDETTHEMIYGNWRLNDWMYGISGGVGLGVFNLIAKYNLSNIFRNKSNYEMYPFMLGTSIRLF